jgi:D-amino-acid oxidase
MPPLAVVVGAGVSGLTCAVRLLEAGWHVHVVARERPEAAVSVGAGAIWEYPPARGPASYAYAAYAARVR